MSGPFAAGVCVPTWNSPGRPPVKGEPCLGGSPRLELRKEVEGDDVPESIMLEMKGGLTSIS